jgi:ATP-dependent protease HslVU (ClpYQ) ATPase subunit
VEDVSFESTGEMQEVIIDESFVQDRLKGLLEKVDFKRWMI